MRVRSTLAGLPLLSSENSLKRLDQPSWSLLCWNHHIRTKFAIDFLGVRDADQRAPWAFLPCKFDDFLGCFRRQRVAQDQCVEFAVLNFGYGFRLGFRRYHAEPAVS